MKRKKYDAHKILKSPTFLLVLIMLFALFLQANFFIGYTAHPSDEGMYIRDSYMMYEGTFIENLPHFYKSLPSNGLHDPSEAFLFRPAFLFPMSLFWHVFGINDFSTVLWVILCFQGIIMVSYFLGNILFNKYVGLLSAFLISVLPLDLLYSTRVSIDIPLTFFMGLSFLLFLMGEKRMEDDSLKGKGVEKYYVLSGLVLGLAYLTKITAITLFGVVIVYLLYKRKIHKYHVLFFGSFLVIFLLEGLFYQSITGHFFLREAVDHGMIKSKHIYEPSQDITISNFLKLRYDESSPLFYTKYILGYPIPVEYFYPRIWIYYSFVLLSILYFVIFRDRNVDVLLIWLLVLFLWLEFGFNSVTVDGSHVLNYWVLQKHDRYMMIITIPSALILSYFLFSLKKFLGGKIFPFVIILVIALTSIHYVSLSANELKDVTSDIKDAYIFLGNYPKKPIYCDTICVEFLKYYHGFDDSTKIFVIPKEYHKLKNIRDSYAIVGGSRTVGICCIEDMQPKKIPESWRLLYEDDKDITSYRGSHMKIYYIP